MEIVIEEFSYESIEEYVSAIEYDDSALSSLDEDTVSRLCRSFVSHYSDIDWELSVFFKLLLGIVTTQPVLTVAIVGTPDFVARCHDYLEKYVTEDELFGILLTLGELFKSEFRDSFHASNLESLSQLNQHFLDRIRNLSRDVPSEYENRLQYCGAIFVFVNVLGLDELKRVLSHSAKRELYDGFLVNFSRNEDESAPERLKFLSLLFSDAETCQGFLFPTDFGNVVIDGICRQLTTLAEIGDSVEEAVPLFEKSAECLVSILQSEVFRDFYLKEGEAVAGGGLRAKIQRCCEELAPTGEEDMYGEKGRTLLEALAGAEQAAGM